MMGAIRNAIGCAFITVGVAILPSDVRTLVRGILLYHVPGALTEDEKTWVREMKQEMDYASTGGKVEHLDGSAAD